MPRQGSSSSSSGSGNSATLLSILTHECVSVGGRLCMDAWLREPLTDAEAIGNRYDMITVLSARPALRLSLRQSNVHTKCLHMCPYIHTIARNLMRIAPLDTAAKKEEDEEEHRQGGAPPHLQALKDIVSLYTAVCRARATANAIADHCDAVESSEGAGSVVHCARVFRGKFGGALKECTDTLRRFENMVDELLDFSTSTTANAQHASSSSSSANTSKGQQPYATVVSHVDGNRRKIRIKHTFTPQLTQ